jgi:hypothetical protein
MQKQNNTAWKNATPHPKKKKKKKTEMEPRNNKKTSCNADVRR